MSGNAKRIVNTTTKHVVGTKPSGICHTHDVVGAADPKHPFQSAHGHDKVTPRQGGNALKQRAIGVVDAAESTYAADLAAEWSTK